MMLSCICGARADISTQKWKMFALDRWLDAHGPLPDRLKAEWFKFKAAKDGKPARYALRLHSWKTVRLSGCQS